MVSAVGGDEGVGWGGGRWRVEGGGWRVEGGRGVVWTYPYSLGTVSANGMVVGGGGGRVLFGLFGMLCWSGVQVRCGRKKNEDILSL